MSETVFINTNFLTPDEMDAKAEELKIIADAARADDKFIRVWCDRGDKTGFPYGQVYVDKWNKQDRWTWIKGRKVERDQAKARKAEKAATVEAEEGMSVSGSADVEIEDGGQLSLPV
jgi:hypothetical protein